MKQAQEMQAKRAELQESLSAYEAEGESGELAEFVRAIEERMAGYIRKVERSDDVRPGQFSGFTIR